MFGMAIVGYLNWSIYSIRVCLYWLIKLKKFLFFFFISANYSRTKSLCLWYMWWVYNDGDEYSKHIQLEF